MISNIFRIFALVNKKVTDISEALQTMTEDMRLMRETIDSQHAEICNLNRNIEALHKEIRNLKKENKMLRDELAKYERPDKNSGNSSTPPSKENIKSETIRRTKTLRKPTGRKSGGQNGHEGSTLNMTRTPDETEDVCANYCTKCGASLQDCERILDYVTQVVSIPELKPVVKEIRHYITVCRQCGERVQSHAPRKRGSNAVVYDASVKSLAVYLSVVMFLPYGRIENFFKEILGLEISQGSFVNWVDEAKRNAAPAIEKIKECIMKSAVVGFDESGLYCNKKLDWTWIAQTVHFTLFFHGSGRS
ncbi:transposase, partial [Parabacteroides distasonis]